MKLTVEIYKETKTSTLSKIYLDGEFTGLFGLEDGFKKRKVKHETRIPRGEYQIIVREHGGFHEKYEDRFPFHQGMLEVADVEGFTDILVHCGNRIKDTSGCLLIGDGWLQEGNDYIVKSSVHAYSILYKKVIEDAKCRTLYIEYVDNRED